MGNYLVTWEIDAEAESPREAAQEAFDAMQREDTWATVFTVEDLDTGKKVLIDLLSPVDGTVANL